MNYQKYIKINYTFRILILSIALKACSNTNVEKFDIDKSVYSPKDYAQI